MLNIEWSCAQQSHFQAYTQEKWKHMLKQKLVHKVHSRIIHKSQNAETTH